MHSSAQNKKPGNFLTPLKLNFYFKLRNLPKIKELRTLSSSKFWEYQLSTIKRPKPETVVEIGSVFKFKFENPSNEK